jgi:hypothetical protein
MILIGIFLLGLLAPFIIVFGVPLALLAFPFYIGHIRHIKPWWDRLPEQTRTKVKWNIVWSLSISMWLVVIWGLMHR